MLKLINILFDILGLNRLNIDNFTDMNVIYDNYDDIHKNKDKVNKCKVAGQIFRWWPSPEQLDREWDGEMACRNIQQDVRNQEGGKIDSAWKREP